MQVPTASNFHLWKKYPKGLQDASMATVKATPPPIDMAMRLYDKIRKLNMRRYCSRTETFNKVTSTWYKTSQARYN